MAVDKFLQSIQNKIADLTDPVKQGLAYDELSRAYKFNQNIFITVYNGFGVVGDTIITYDGPAKRVVIPKSIQGNKIKRIGSGVFMDSSIVHLEIEDGVEQIGRSAFSGCKHLKYVSLPASIALVEEKAFDEHQEYKILEISINIDEKDFNQLLFNGISLIDKRLLLGRDCLNSLVVNNDYINNQFLANAPATLDKAMGPIFYKYLGNWEALNFFNNVEIKDEEIGVIHKIKSYSESIISNETDLKNDRIFREHKPKERNIRRVSLIIVDRSKARKVNGKYLVKLEVFTAYAFYQSLQRVILNKETYYVYRRNYLSHDVKHPYYSQACEVYSEYGKVTNQELCQDIWKKYYFLSALE